MKKLIIKIAAAALLIGGFSMNLLISNEESGSSMNIQLCQIEAQACCGGEYTGFWYTCQCGGMITCYCASGYSISARDAF